MQTIEINLFADRINLISIDFKIYNKILNFHIFKIL
jgi:hypothetical protein